MSMKKRITVQLCVVGGIAIVVTTMLSMFVYYMMFQRQIFSDLETNLEVIEVLFGDGTIENGCQIPSEDVLRVTLIDQEGAVLYDSDANSFSMENHKERPEIKEALKEGIGKDIRVSNTIGQNTYYYAKQIGNNYVLRVAKEANGMLALFYEALPIIIVGAILLLLICSLLAKYLTKRIVRPIENMAQELSLITEFEEIVPYEELIPFATMIKDQHSNIHKQLRDLEHSEKIRQEFTANVSHELKTPLTAITGYSELIEEGIASQGDTIRFAKEIRKNATRLLHLINDIIELSELDIAEEEVKKDELDLYEIAKNCTDTLKITAKNHEVELKLIGNKVMLYANKNMMEELITNLCDNAIRYNKKGGIVKVVLYSKDENVILTVEDTGIGIPKEHFARVFERFYRVDKSRSKQTGGTGLGLAIVKHIVAKHGAKITLKSEVMIGTTVTIEFPSQNKVEKK